MLVYQIHFINITQYIKKKIILSKITGMKYLKKDVFFRLIIIRQCIYFNIKFCYIFFNIFFKFLIILLTSEFLISGYKGSRKISLDFLKDICKFFLFLIIFL